MNICDIIQKKKDSLSLTKDEIDFWLCGMLDGTIADYQTSALLMAITLKGLDENEVFFLTDAMKNSGDIIDMSAYGKLSADKHSSGGVGDTATLIVLPILVASGFKCGKMSGRGLGFTGGTLDKLESVDNVNINLTKEQFFEQIDSIGVALAGQTANLCPADKKLYALRDVTATVDSIGLIAASIMSKKLASGAHNIVLDVKCGKGAFMSDIKNATALATLMVKIGKLAGKNISAVITDMDSPLSRYVGNRLEIIGALRVLQNIEKGDLYDVSIALSSQLMKSCGIDNAEDKAKDAIASGNALEVFVQMMRAQGAIKNFENELEDTYKNTFTYELVSQKDCYVKSIDALTIAKVVSALGGGREKVGDTIDYVVGVEIVKTQATYVKKGEIIAKVFYSHADQLAICKKVADAFSFSDKKVESTKRILDIIN